MALTVYRLHGPPGTGKTYALAMTWVPRAVARYGADRVMCCSLTRAAATELGARVDLPREQVGTLHSFAFRALGRPTIAESKIDEWNTAQPYYTVEQRGKPSTDDPWESSSSGILNDLGVRRHRRTPPSEWVDEERDFHAKWTAWLDSAGYLDFTGLLEQCLERQIPCPVGHAMIFVDEAQDCSVLELDLVRMWARDADGLVLVGDSLQAIYEWRGADPRAFLGPEVRPEDERELRQSYRLPRAVHAVSVAIAREMTVGRLVDYQPRDAAGFVDHSPANLRDAASLVQLLHDELGATDGRVMLLASCGYMLHGVIAKLREDGIPFDHPWRRNRGDWNPLHGAARRLLGWLTARDRPWTWGELAGWADHVKADGLFTKGSKGVIGLHGDDEATASRPVPDADLVPLFEPGEAGRALQAAEAADLAWLESRLLDGHRKAWDYPLAVCRQRGPDALREEPRLTLGTIHSVKGAEASTVIVLPDLAPKATLAWLSGDEGKDAVLRMFYVAVTRARERLVLCQSGGRGFYQWPDVSHAAPAAAEASE